MGSPAKVLADLFESVSAQSEQRDSFALAASRVLGRESRHDAIEVLGRIVDLIEESHHLITLIGTDNKQKSLIGRYLAPLEPFRSFSVFHYSVKDAKDSFLQRSVIDGLFLLDVMLSNVSDSAQVSEQARSEVETLTKFMEQIHDLELPDPMRDALLVRMIQMLDMLNHFEFFGQKNLEQKIDALLGRITVSSAATTKKNKVTLQSIAKTVVKIGAGIIFANSVANSYVALTESIPEILSLPSPDTPAGA